MRPSVERHTRLPFMISNPSLPHQDVDLDSEDENAGDDAGEDAGGNEGGGGGGGNSSSGTGSRPKSTGTLASAGGSSRGTTAGTLLPADVEETVKREIESATASRLAQVCPGLQPSFEGGRGADRAGRVRHRMALGSGAPWFFNFLCGVHARVFSCIQRLR